MAVTKIAIGLVAARLYHEDVEVILVPFLESDPVLQAAVITKLTDMVLGVIASASVTEAAHHRPDPLTEDEHMSIAELTLQRWSLESEA
jgi:hypothetical protein